MKAKLVLRFILVRLVWPCVYRVGCLRRVNPRRVLFGSEFHEAPPENLRLLLERFRAEGYGCHWFGKARARKPRQILRTLIFVFDYASAAILFVDDSFSPALACPPRKGQALVQVWHGCGAFKRFGHSAADSAWGPSARVRKWLPMHLHYTHVCVSAPEVIPHYAEAFRCPPERVHAWGAPRTDVFFDAAFTATARERVLAAFPEIGGRKILLYAPTFRGDSVRESRHDAALDLPFLAAQLGGDCVLLLKPHPHVPFPLAEGSAADFAFDARALPIEALLCAADLLIADYSSLVFEYALLGRPMLFFAYDLDAYDAARSFYYPYRSFVPGDILEQCAEIPEAVRGQLFGNAFDKARVEHFARRFMPACDGHCTERILARFTQEGNALRLS
ncbi:MAG: CDP-glycerol glycerophosphotransferase family protein [Oscillospiraceae bacterium]|nr:CDP-glycerol glycerophosphotransferase family protein [Oscillospiraceae bacterium]